MLADDSNHQQLICYQLLLPGDNYEIPAQQQAG
jgi:hypothetical protein